MKHFSEQAWIDFVRGLPPRKGEARPPEGTDFHADLESHLAAGCLDCTTTHGFWKQVYGVAARESDYCPPENAVRVVKLEFAASHQQRAAQAHEASLVFDTLSQPLLAGIRSITAAARQLLYEADGLTVDLRFDRHPRSNKVHLIGQVLAVAKSRASIAGLPVMLWTEEGMPVAENVTNDFGEFHLAFAAQDHLRLSIQVADNKLIRIALANLQQKTELDRTGDGTDDGNC